MTTMARVASWYIHGFNPARFFIPYTYGHIYIYPYAHAYICTYIYIYIYIYMHIYIYIYFHIHSPGRYDMISKALGAHVCTVHLHGAVGRPQSSCRSKWPVNPVAGRWNKTRNTQADKGADSNTSSRNQRRKQKKKKDKMSSSTRSSSRSYSCSSRRGIIQGQRWWRWPCCWWWWWWWWWWWSGWWS